MKKQILMICAISGVLLLLPLQARAQICFAVAPLNQVLVLSLTGPPAPGGFFNLVGIRVNDLPSTPDRFNPLNGSAHLRLDGKAHFGVIIHGGDATTPVEWWQGTLNPPDFNTGTGFYRESGGGSGPLTFSPAPCPLPH